MTEAKRTVREKGPSDPCERSVRQIAELLLDNHRDCEEDCDERRLARFAVAMGEAARCEKCFFGDGVVTFFVVSTDPNVCHDEFCSCDEKHALGYHAHEACSHPPIRDLARKAGW